MRDEPDRQVSCGSCGLALPMAETESPLQERRPCPGCGSPARAFALTVSSRLEVRGGIRLKHRRPGRPRPLLEYVDEPDVQRDTGQPSRVLRCVDRLTDRYRELVLDEGSGQLLHARDEPLSRHRGHGADKGPRSSPAPVLATPAAVSVQPDRMDPPDRSAGTLSGW